MINFFISGFKTPFGFIALTGVHCLPYMAVIFISGFKTPLGFIALSGVHCLPIWLYACDSNFLSDLGLNLWYQYSGTALLLIGRLLALRVEVRHNIQ